jgi:superoxide reductase
MFGDLFAGVNEPSDPRNLSDLERMHVPVIRAPEAVSMGAPFQLEVEIGGGLSHPADPGHFIQFIEVCADDLVLGRADLTAGRARPRISLLVTLHRPASELRAYANCNLHGIWIGRKPITVRQA